MQTQFMEFHPQGRERLFVAVVNRAILDVLGNGEEAKETERQLEFQLLRNPWKLVNIIDWDKAG
jgi:hypothetical protein